jgi:hypothetical protein
MGFLSCDHEVVVVVVVWFQFLLRVVQSAGKQKRSVIDCLNSRQPALFNNFVQKLLFQILLVNRMNEFSG